MRRIGLLASVLCLLWIGLAPAGAAEKQKAADGSARHGKAAKAAHGGRGIALLDVGALLKADPDFKKAEEDLKADVARAEIDLKNELARLQVEGGEVERLPADSAQRSGRQSLLVRRKAELQARLQGLRDQFAQRESKVYSKYFQKIRSVVGPYAKAHKLLIVINFSSELDNPIKPTDVARQVVQPIVWHAEGIDITPAIAKLLERARAEEAKKAASQPTIPEEKPVAPEKPVPAAPAPPMKPAVPPKTEPATPPKTEPPAPPKTSPAAAKGAAKPAEDSAEEEDEDESPPAAPQTAKPEKKPAPTAKPEENKAGKKAEEKKSEGKKADHKSMATKPAEKKAIVVCFTIKGDYTEGPTQPGLFSEMRPTLATIVQRLDQAAEDKAVAAVLLRIEDLDMGGGKINELRAAIGRIRKAGKPVYAELADADTGQYLLAVACNEIYMSPCGMLVVPGIHAEVTFYKGLMDKLGLKFDALQMGKYKGAAEPLTRSRMSPAMRENMEAIVDDSYEAMVALIASGRGLKDYAVKTWMDQGLFSASTALQAGLIDRVCYADQFEAGLAKKLKVDRIEMVTDYKKKRVDTDFSGVGGLLKLVGLFTGATPAEKPSAEKRIAVVYAVGEIVEGKAAGDMWGNSALGSTTLIEALRKASDDPKVVAVVLRVDSPGGSATASDLIWRETVRLKKPLIASMGDVAGSGGYYIAMAARTIVAEPGTITGSIGVIGGKLVTGGLYEKLGLTTDIVSRGKNSGALSSTQPFTPEERRAWTALLEETYGQFVGKAAQGRKMDRKRVEELAQGRIYTGRMAKKNGLVDEVGTLQDAIALAKKAAGLKPDTEVELLILPQPKSVFEQIFGDSAASSDMDSVLPDLFHLVRQAKVWGRMFRDKTLLWMPYQVRVR
jgi:protease-4